MNTSEQWHKALVLVLRKLGIIEILITDDDMRPLLDKAPDDQLCVILDHQGDGLHVRLSTVAGANAYASIAALDSSIAKPN